MYRLLTAAVIVLWLSAMATLFVQDVLPSWTAQSVPPFSPGLVAEQDQQCGIFLSNGTQIGRAWSSVEVNSSSFTASLSGTVLIEGLPLINAIRIETVSEFDAEGSLDSFNLRVFGVRIPGVRRGPGARIRVHGERRGIYFPCEMQFGTLRKEANLDVSASRLIGDSLRPFSYLPTLSVGQAWRMQILDPVAVALTGKTQFKSIIARVTGVERIAEGGKEIDCFVVETSPDKTKAWVDKVGRVVRQEVELPGVGTIILREEEYKKELRMDAAKRVPAWSDDGQ